MEKESLSYELEYLCELLNYRRRLTRYQIVPFRAMRIWFLERKIRRCEQRLLILAMATKEIAFTPTK